MNQFNSQLKKSLLSPKKGRYIATKNEQETEERVDLSPKLKQINSRNGASRRNLSMNEGGILPIITVGSSINSVEYQDYGKNCGTSRLNLSTTES